MSRSKRRLLFYGKKKGGDEGIRTLDPQIANLMLSQLSYVPNAAHSNPIDRRSQAKFFTRSNIAVEKKFQKMA